MKLRQIAKHCNNLGGGGKLGGTTQIRGGGQTWGHDTNSGYQFMFR